MRRRNKLATGLLMTALSAAFASPTGAVPLTFEFGGVIDFVEPGLPISNQIAAGTPYRAVYQFDPEGVEDIIDLPTSGNYPFGNAGYMSADIGALNFTTQDLRVSIGDSPLLDRYGVGSMTPFVGQSVLWQGMALDLRDATHTAFDSDALPLTAPDLNDFEFSQLFFLIQPNRRDPSITGTVTYLNMIPEPSSLASLFAAAAVISLRRRHPHRAP